MITTSEFVRLLLDPVRLAVAGDAVGGVSDPEDLAARLGVGVRAVLEARAKLMSTGVIVDGAVDAAVLRSIAQQLPGEPPPSAVVVDGPWTSEEVDILGRFFSGGRLQSIPSNNSKRRIVLDRLAQEFEPGLRYEEADVNFRLQLFHADYAALRRYLVDEGMLSRADGVYWRTGGRYREDQGEDEWSEKSVDAPGDGR